MRYTYLNRSGYEYGVRDTETIERNRVEKACRKISKYTERSLYTVESRDKEIISQGIMTNLALFIARSRSIHLSAPYWMNHDDREYHAGIPEEYHGGEGHAV